MTVIRTLNKLTRREHSECSVDEMKWTVSERKLRQEAWMKVNEANVMSVINRNETSNEANEC